LEVFVLRLIAPAPANSRLPRQFSLALAVLPPFDGFGGRRLSRTRLNERDV
jgi:hypothetical protein